MSNFLVYCCLFKNSPCITEFALGNIDAIGVEGDTSYQLNEISDCYESIPDSESVVYGKNIKSECYVHNSLKYFHFGEQNINRCGQCLEITGPSSTPYTCMIAGFFDLTNPSNSTEESKHFIVASEEFYFSVANRFESSSLVFSQVTVQAIDCGYNVVPSLHTLNQNQENITIQIVNANTLLERIKIGSVEYFMNELGQFSFPIPTSLVDIQIISYYYDVVGTKTVNFTKTSSLSFPNQFPYEEHTQCAYNPTEIIYDNTTELGNNSFLSWEMFLVDSSLNVYNLTQKQGGVSFESVGIRTTLLFYYFTSVQLSHYYNDVVLDLDISGNASFLMSNIAVNHRRESANGGSRMQIKVPFNKANHQFANIIAITFETEEYPSFVLNKATLNKIQDASESCDIDSFDCSENIECSTSKLWSDGCAPYCGTCRIGYSCSDDGQCDTEVNFNQRSYCVAINVIFLVALVIYLL
ncbi:Uncharacterized protein QTN25_005196 [Entamoeba marina]